METQSLEFLKRLIATPSPSGYEVAVGAEYAKHVSAFADDVSSDINGNVIAVLNPGAAMKVMLAGHMDEIGFIIHYIDDAGLLYFSTIGGHDSPVPIGQMVWVHGKEKLAGAVGRKAIHLMDPGELQQKPKFADLWIDIGARSRQEAEKVVALGDVVTFQHEFQPLLGDFAAARGFDNKAGLFVVAEALRLLKKEGGLDPEVGVYAVATTQEEIGSRGAQTAAFSIRPQTGLTVDMGHARDLPGIAMTRHGQLDIGKGPGISRGPNTHHRVFALLTDAAATNKIPHQISVTPGTSPTDARALQVNRGGMATGLLEVPLRYMHTPCEVLSLSDVEATARLVAAYCRMITPETDFAVTQLTLLQVALEADGHRLGAQRGPADV
jgi:putative aminopeptidase FrvX